MPAFPRCDHCPVDPALGACFPIRAGNPTLCRIRPWRTLIAGWGANGGPPLPPPDPPPGVPTLDPDTFVTSERLARDTLALLAKLPPDVDLVVAIARSGLIVGAPIAAHLHVPLWTLSRSHGLIDPGGGGRMEGREDRPPRRVLLVDDTAAMGREMRAGLPVVQAAFPGAAVTRGVVYCHPQALDAVDLCAAVLPGGHFLQWNAFCAGHGSAMGLDFDGILCRECRPEEDDDGERYAEFLRTAEPLNLPRRRPIPLIVTARHEKYRAVTMGWLARWGLTLMHPDYLIMRDFECDPANRLEQIAQFKARHYAASGCALFAESEEWQARRIAEITGRAVLCPIAQRVFRGTPKRQVDRSKPRMALGQPQKPREGCVSCAEMARGRA